VTQAFATSPLRLLTPANHGEAAWIYQSSYGGGLVDGDSIDLDVTVAPAATAFVSTQAATKVYRSPRGTQAMTRGRVGPGAVLVMAPDPVVCFTGARYRQRQRFDIDGSGGLVLVDGLVSGRYAAGERWAFDEYHSVIDVTVSGRRIVYDAIALRAADGPLADRLGRFDVLAVGLVIGAAFAAEIASLLELASGQAVTRRAGQLMTIAPLGEAGCLVRIAGSSLEAVGRSLRTLLQFVPDRLGDDPWRRKW
jgi:urease accessory protein